MRDKRMFVEIIIGALLIFSTWSYTRYYRNDLVLNLQSQLEQLDRGIIASTNLLQRGFNAKQLNIQDFINLGWDLSIPKPADPVTNKNNPSK